MRTSLSANVEHPAQAARCADGQAHVPRSQAELLSEELAWARTRYQVMAALLAHARHELRSPLHSILGYAALLQRDASRVPREDCAAAITEAGQRLMKNIDGLFDIGADCFDPSTNDPRVTKWDDFFHALAGDARVLLRDAISLHGAPPQTLLLDAPRLRWAVRSLLTCAYHGARQLSPRMELGVACEAGQAHLAVRLRGLEPSLLGQLEPDGGGLGAEFGMLMQWIHSIGGITKVAMAPDRALGIDIDLAFPVVVGPQLAAAPADPYVSGYWGRRRTVLIVDDDEVNRVLLHEILTETGFIVVDAGSGNEAAGLLDASIDIVVTDQLMDDGDGWALLRLLRQRLPHCPAVLLSGMDETTDPAGELAFSAVLRKPTDSQLVLSTLGLLLQLQWIADAPPATADAGGAAIAMMAREQWHELAELVRLGLVTDILEFGRAQQGEAAGEDQKKFFDALIASASKLDFCALRQLVERGTRATG